jgi:hypothetical protein
VRDVYPCGGLWMSCDRRGLRRRHAADRLPGDRYGLRVDVLPERAGRALHRDPHTVCLRGRRSSQRVRVVAEPVVGGAVPRPLELVDLQPGRGEGMQHDAAAPPEVGPTGWPAPWRRSGVKCPFALARAGLGKLRGAGPSLGRPRVCGLLFGGGFGWLEGDGEAELFERATRRRARRWGSWLAVK